MEEFAKKTTEELEKMLLEKREQLRKFRFEVTGSRTRNVRGGREMRRLIAKIMTSLHSRKKV